MWANFIIQVKNIPIVGNFNKDDAQKYYLQDNADINKYYKHFKINK